MKHSTAHKAAQFFSVVALFVAITMFIRYDNGQFASGSVTGTVTELLSYGILVLALQAVAMFIKRIPVLIPFFLSIVSLTLAIGLPLYIMIPNSFDALGVGNGAYLPRTNHFDLLSTLEVVSLTLVPVTLAIRAIREKSRV